MAHLQMLYKQLEDKQVAPQHNLYSGTANVSTQFVPTRQIQYVILPIY